MPGQQVMSASRKVVVLLEQTVEMHHPVDEGQVMGPGQSRCKVGAEMSGHPWMDQLMVRWQGLLHFRPEMSRKGCRTIGLRAGFAYQTGDGEVGGALDGRGCRAARQDWRWGVEFVLCAQDGS